jgi:hypothetical protein
MLKRLLLPAALSLLVALLATHARAEEPQSAAPGSSESSKSEPATSDAAKSEPAKSEPATQEQLKALAEELRRLKLEIGLPDAEYRSFAGMGPAASKVYFVPKGLSLGGYGEAFYRNNLNDVADDVSDILRVVLYTGYRFTDKILFNSEVEFEHQSQVFVEFAYLDFLLSEPVKLRAGNLLVPMGFTNELHEPVFFNSVERPEVERNIIPTTWNENGVGVYGDLAPGLRYKVYGLAGLSAARAPTATSWVRGMRTRGGNLSGSNRSFAETFAGVAALTYEYGPGVVGASIYHGRSGQGQTVSATDTRVISGDITMYEAHAGVSWRGAAVRALAVQGELTDGDLINAKHGLTGGADLARASIGSRVRGAYVEGSFDVLSLAASEQSLLPFVRYELLKFHDEVPTGATKDPRLDVDLVVAGIAYKPIPTVALKSDWNWRRTAAQTGAVSRLLNVGIAFVF